MINLILFVNSFLSYILLMIVIVIVATVGFIIGLKWRKAKEIKVVAEAETAREVQSEME